MNKEYTIDKVSSKIKEWEGQFGKMVTYHIKFPNNDEVIEMNRKPDSPAPKVGDTVFGEIKQTEFGYRFHGAKTPQGQKTFGKSQGEQWAIMRMNALGSAVNHIGASIDNKPNPEKVLDTAEKFYAWLVVTGDKQKDELEETVDKLFSEDKEEKGDF